MKTQVLVALLFFVATVEAQISDTTPPKLVEFGFSPTVVDISTNGQWMTLTARITDDLSGFGTSDPDSLFYSYANVVFRPAGAEAFIQLSAHWDPFSRISGNELDGVYKTELYIPANSRTGVWTAASFVLADAVRNTTNLNALDLQWLGAPISFTVKGVDNDRNPPELLSLTLEPPAVDTSSSNNVITITAHLREDRAWLSGVDANGRPFPPVVFIAFQSPSKTQRLSVPLSEISEDVLDGMFTGTLQMPKLSEPGVWRLSGLRAIDQAQNSLSLDINAAQEKGFDVQFTVAGVGNAAPPKLRGLDFFPRRIGPPTTNQTVTATMRYTDEDGGIFPTDEFGNPFPSPAYLEFRSPSGRQTVTAFMEPGSAHLEPVDIGSTNTFTFPRFCETGLWTLTRVQLADAFGTTTRWDTTVVRELGFPTEIAVGIEPAITITLQENAILLSWPSWGRDFRLESRAVDEIAWTTLQAQPSAISDQMIVAIPKPEKPQFFRLAQ
jgi:hypothetical protein